MCIFVWKTEKADKTCIFLCINRSGSGAKTIQNYENARKPGNKIGTKSAKISA